MAGFPSPATVLRSTPRLTTPCARCARVARGRSLEGSLPPGRRIRVRPRGLSGIPRNVEYLVRYFAENLDEGEGNFIEKLEAQLAPAPPTAKQLAAEMLWVMYLILVPSAMQPGTKRQQIQRVWEWSGEDLP